jgi:hypothetical protein
MALNLEAALKITANVVGENNIRRLGNSMQGLEGQAKNANRSLATISDGFRGLNGVLIGLGGGFTLAKIFGDTATLESQTNSLQVLTGSAAQAATIIDQLRSFANVTPVESTELIETAKRLNAFGVQGQRVVEVTKQLGDIAGATGANISELATAYGQVVAKGRLQGEELLQFTQSALVRRLCFRGECLFHDHCRGAGRMTTGRGDLSALQRICTRRRRQRCGILLGHHAQFQQLVVFIIAGFGCDGVRARCRL